MQHIPELAIWGVYHTVDFAVSKKSLVLDEG